MSVRFGVGIGVPKLLGMLAPRSPWNSDVADSLIEICFSPPVLARQIWSFQVKLYERKGVFRSRAKYGITLCDSVYSMARAMR